MLKVLLHKPIISIIGIVVVMLVFNIDSIPVSIMEARNFVTAREMVEDGNWLLTTMNGEARYEKPPLPTWMTAIFGWVFGFKSLLAIRFPGILFIGLIGIFTYLLSRKLLSDSLHSILNALIVISSFYVIGILLEAPWDIFTHGFMLISIYHLFQLFQQENKYWDHVLLAGIFMGCSFLCKGPISMYALLIPFLLAYGFTYKFVELKSKLVPLLACLILAFIIGGWWFIYVRMMDPLTFETIAIRETNNWHSYNTKPVYYYWSFFIQSGIWTIPAFISLLYPYLKNRVSNLKAYQFSWLWTIFAVVLLSLIPEKKSRYLMPVLIPLAINTGFYIEYLIRRFKSINDKRELIPGYFNFGLIAFIAIALPVLLFIFIGNAISNWDNFLLFSIVTIMIGAFLLFHLKKKHIANVFLLTIAFFVSLFVFALPILKEEIGTYNNSITSLDSRTSLKIYGFNGISPEMIWHYGDKIPPIKLDDGTYDFPADSQFGMFGINISPEDWDVLGKNYSIRKVETFDLNTVSPESKRYNERLVNDYYILTQL